MLAISMALADDERKTFENLYLEHRQLAFHVANKILHNETLSEDAVSEAFLRIAEIYSRIKNLNSHKMQYYIVVTVRNTCFNMTKQAEYTRAVFPLEESILKSEHSEIDSDYIFLTDCISRLSETDKEILYLRVNLGFSFKEIAKTLSISVAAARQRHRYAKNNLKKLLAKGEKSL